MLAWQYQFTIKRMMEELVPPPRIWSLMVQAGKKRQNLCTTSPFPHDWVSLYLLYLPEFYQIHQFFASNWNLAWLPMALNEGFVRWHGCRWSSARNCLRSRLMAVWATDMWAWKVREPIYHVTNCRGFFFPTSGLYHNVSGENSSNSSFFC